jgi:hypothetical protein
MTWPLIGVGFFAFGLAGRVGDHDFWPREIGDRGWRVPAGRCYQELSKLLLPDVLEA